MTDWLMIAVGVVLTVGTALFVAGEFSLVALDPSTVETRAATGDKRATTVQRALGRLSTLLSGAQVGITLTTVLLGYTMQAALANLLTGLMSHWLAVSVATGAAVVIALIVVNAFSMVIGELIPKNATLADPMRAAGLVAPFLMGFTTLLKPLIVLLNGAANAVLHAMGIEPAEELSGTRSAGELASLVRHSAEEGTLDASTATLLTRSIGLGALTAVDVMTDRGRLHTLDADDTAEDVVHLARATGHSRFPVIGRDVDDVMGIVHLRRAIGVPYERRADVPVASTSLMTPAPRVPETMPLANLLIELRAQGSQMAIVVDEYGGTAGLVTMEDLLEEVVGELTDEHDPELPEVVEVAPGTYRVPARLALDELGELFDLEIDDDDVDTVGGLLTKAIGRVPLPGAAGDTQGVHLQAEEATGRRRQVSTILASRTPAPEEDTDD